MALLILIEENIRRRQLSTLQIARAIKRLYEVKGIDRDEGGDRRSPATVAGVKQIAEETGKSERTVARLRTIADLIPELAKLLDAGRITQKLAYQLAQMDDDGQKCSPAHRERAKRR